MGAVGENRSITRLGSYWISLLAERICRSGGFRSDEWRWEESAAREPAALPLPREDAWLSNATEIDITPLRS
jgi:hypothetical protein